MSGGFAAWTTSNRCSRDRGRTVHQMPLQRPRVLGDVCRGRHPAPSHGSNRAILHAVDHLDGGPVVRGDVDSTTTTSHPWSRSDMHSDHTRGSRVTDAFSTRRSVVATS